MDRIEPIWSGHRMIVVRRFGATLVKLRLAELIGDVEHHKHGVLTARYSYIKECREDEEWDVWDE